MFTEIQNKIIQDTEILVKDFMKNYDDSHNFEHVLRVKILATKIAESQNLTNDEIFEIQLGALTHDIHDHKYTQDLYAQETILTEFFENKLNKNILKNVIQIACNVSLSKETALKHNNIYIQCHKLDCVRDADRIDSLGSIGITRYFVYGIKTNKNIHDIMINMKRRTEILISSIKTELGKQLAHEKYQIIKLFLDDYFLNTAH